MIFLVILLLVALILLIYLSSQNSDDSLSETIVLKYHEEMKAHSDVVPAKQINLFVEYYLSGNSDRQKEIDSTFQNNLNEPGINHIYIIVHNLEEIERIHSLKTNGFTLIPIKVSRPTYGQLFSIMRKYGGNDDINILANSDMAFNSTINLVRQLRTNEVLALTRWNLYSTEKPFQGKLESHIGWSQDVWIFRGYPHSDLCDISFTTGVLRCDNRLAYLLHQSGYSIFNPCYDIHTWHIHKSNFRTYSENDKLKGMGAFIPLCNWV